MLSVCIRVLNDKIPVAGVFSCCNCVMILIAKYLLILLTSTNSIPSYTGHHDVYGYAHDTRGTFTKKFIHRQDSENIDSLESVSYV